MGLLANDITDSVVLIGSQFSEPMRVVGNPTAGDGFVIVNLVGTRTSTFRGGVTLTKDDLAKIQMERPAARFGAKPRLFKLGLEALRISLAQEYDPFFGLSISRVDPLPHQLDAVYNHLLKSARVRFLLADDAGAGKTIMAGLLLKELKLRGLVERVLIVCPANLAFQWQRELADRFQETFHILRGADLRVQYGVNLWNDKPQIITSMDLAKRDEILPSVRQAEDWDLVIVDEAHRMSARDVEHKSERYRLGELLREKTAHYLLLTATPHKGDPGNFSLFLQLLDQEAYADVKSIHDAMDRREAACYLRRTKEVMLNFPKPQADGSWKAEKLFTKRIPTTVAFSLEGDEMELYRAVTQYVQRQSARAAEAGDDRRARAVGFIMAMYQRRMASSTHSLKQSLLRRQKSLKQLLETANHLGELPMPDIPTDEEWEEMDDAEREAKERELERATLARRKPELEEELKDIADLIAQAQQVEDGGHELKLRRLKAQLTEQGIFSDRNVRLLLFTEYKDTLDYLVAKLKAWGLTVGQIHGGMKPGSRDEEGTRLYAERSFWDLKTQVLVATEAAGEGINLQCCHVLFNYDIPWNPSRLEQRMGRIHRYGQTKDCLIFNFFAQNTVEGKVLHKLLEKLQVIRDALDDDAVFNVVGEVLPSNQIERLLRDFYAGKLSANDIEARLEVEVREEDFRNICKSALEGLAKKNLNLPMLVERRAMAQERRIVPETVARFFESSAKETGLTLNPITGAERAFRVGRVPTALYDQARTKDWRLPQLAKNYDRICFERATLDTDARLEWVTPGHPLFEAVRRQIWDQTQPQLRQGVVLYELEREQPALLELFIAEVADGTGNTLHRRLFLVETNTDSTRRLRDPAYLLDLIVPDKQPQVMPTLPVDDPRTQSFLFERALQPFLKEIAGEREHELDLIERSVRTCFEELIAKRDAVLAKHMLAQERGDPSAIGLAELEGQKLQELQRRRDLRLTEMARQRSLSLQGVERIGLALALPHPERNSPATKNLKADRETERKAVGVVIAYEQARGCKIEDVQDQNLGFDLRSLHPVTGESRLIEVKGIGAATGTIFLSPNERRMCEERRDLYWLYVVTHCDTEAKLEDPIKDPARFPWHEVKKVEHYRLDVNAMTQPLQLKEDTPPYRTGGS
ncbi:MAG: DEAD/DEAH box helicase [Verrucomicrobia bacterium]|nr:DEAD/DEAH box helicase [Verrucomicrobiota bacterium]